MTLKEGKSIEQPTYSYLTCTRQPETIHIEPREVVIIEGILALCDKKLRNMMDLKIFVDADPDERLIRVIQRDVIERGRTAEAVMERYTRVLNLCTCNLSNLANDMPTLLYRKEAVIG